MKYIVAWCQFVGAVPMRASTAVTPLLVFCAATSSVGMPAKRAASCSSTSLSRSSVDAMLLPSGFTVVSSAAKISGRSVSKVVAIRQKGVKAAFLIPAAVGAGRVRDAASARLVQPYVLYRA